MHNDWTTVRAAWSPHHQQAPEFRARTLVFAGGDPSSDDTTEFWLDPSTSSERPAQASGDDLFSDRRITEAPLPGIRAPIDRAVVDRDRWGVVPGIGHLAPQRGKASRHIGRLPGNDRW